jgi:hypothetical protein
VTWQEVAFGIGLLIAGLFFEWLIDVWRERRE